MARRAWVGSLLPLPAAVFLVSAWRPGAPVDGAAPPATSVAPVQDAIAGCDGEQARSLEAALLAAQVEQLERARRSADWESVVYAALDACPEVGLEPLFVGCEDEPCLVVGTVREGSDNPLRDLDLCGPLYERFHGDPGTTFMVSLTCPDGVVVPVVAWSPQTVGAGWGTKQAEVERRATFERVEEAAYEGACAPTAYGRGATGR